MGAPVGRVELGHTVRADSRSSSGSRPIANGRCRRLRVLSVLQPVVGAHGAPLSAHVDGIRAEAEKWGVSPLWGGGQTQHRERARRAREEAVRYGLSLSCPSVRRQCPLLVL